MLQRLLLTKNIELYAIKESLYEDVKAFMMFLDYNRSSRFEDFSFIPGFEESHFQSRQNYIKAIILYEKKPTEKEMEEYYEIASGFLEDKDNCDWGIEYIKIKLSSMDDMYDEDEMAYARALNPILEKLGYEDVMGAIEPSTFKNLMQS